MPGKTYVGYASERFSDSSKKQPITRVEVYNRDIVGSAGSGAAASTLRVELPTVTSTASANSAASHILSKVGGVRYQPYESASTVLEPAAEIGDGVNICGDYGGIYSQTQIINNACRSDISAPSEDEIDSEYNYKERLVKIGAEQIVSGSIDADRIGANTITSNKIAAETIVAGNMATDSIINRCIASGSIAKTTCNSEVQGILTDALYAADVFAGRVTASYLYTSNISFGTTSGMSTKINGNTCGIYTVQTTGGASVKVVAY